MSNPIIILMDDVHLEGRPEDTRHEFAQKVKNHIALIKASGDKPIVVCAGDIGEGIEGVKWASQFDCEVVYVCGNHEFWNQDYYNVISNINDYVKSYPNIHFLYNQSCVIDGVRFIGGTLWTSLGAYLPVLDKNYSIRFYGAMGDFKRAKATHWYTPKNEKRLKLYLKQNGVDEEKIKDLIDNKLFNPLFEIEENQKSIEYFIETLSLPFEGKTVVVSHHLPCYQLWMKKFNIQPEYIQGEWVNNERFFYDSAKGNMSYDKDILMMSFYANDLKDLMFGELAPEMWLHGHLHQEMTEMVGKTQIISSPVGYQKQSKEMTFKDLDFTKRHTYIANYVKNEINNYAWGEKLITHLHKLEVTINNFESAISMKALVAHDFDHVLRSTQKVHEYNLDMLKHNITQWLKPFVYDKHPEITDSELDDYVVKKLSGFSEQFPLAKFPEVLAAAVNDHSFLDDASFQIANKGGLKFYHYKEWLKELQRIQIQIGQYKKCLLDFCDNYKK